MNTGTPSITSGKAPGFKGLHKSTWKENYDSLVNLNKSQPNNAVSFDILKKSAKQAAVEKQ